MKEKIDTEKLRVHFYFFVIKRDKIDAKLFGININQEVVNESIGVVSFMSGGQFDEFYNLLINNEYELGTDFVEGISDGLTGINYSKNDWLKFETIDDEDFVSYQPPV